MNKIDKKTYDYILGVSGGVDSTSSLIMLHEKGMNILAVHLLLNDELESEYIDIKDICKKYNIDFLLYDARKEFTEKVKQYFINSYLQGKTPNPCVICNRNIKMQILYDLANKYNARYFSTGHYAGIDKYNDSIVIKKGKEDNKEQSYFLGLIKKEVLNKLSFPLDKTQSKDELRKYLKERNILIYSKSDSQDICFVQNGKHEEFCMNFLNKKELPDVEIYLHDKKIKNGKNIFNYTIGKRKGLGVSYKEPLYVVDIDMGKSKPKVILAEKEKLEVQQIYGYDLNLFIPQNELIKLSNENKLKIKTRYSKKEEIGKIEILSNNEIMVIFKNPIIKPAKEQLIAIYYEDFLLGGALVK